MASDQQPISHIKSSAQQLDIHFALQAAGLGVWEIDLITNQVLFDDHCQTLIGLNKTRQLSLDEACQYVHPDDYSRLIAAIHRAINPTSGGRFNEVCRLMNTASGTFRWVRFWGTGYFTPAHKLYRFAGAAQEVANSVPNQQQLEQGEKRFRSLIEQAPVATGLFVGPTFIIEEANAPILQFWGKGPDVIGKPLIEVLPELAGQPFLKILDEVYKTGKPYQATADRCELVIDGQLRTFYFNFTYQPIFDDQGHVFAVMDMVIDVTEQVLVRQQLEESEARFRTMAEGTNLLIAVGDESSNAIYFNRAWADLTGRPIADLLQFGWVDLVHPDDREGYVNIYLEAFRVHGPFAGEFRVLDAQGDYRWLLANGVARFQADGTFAGYISSCIDITSRKKSENEQAEARLVLERAFEQARLSKEAAQLGTFDMDLLAGTMVWDERCRLLFGISHQNAVSYESDFVRGLHPDDRERIVNIINDVFIKSVSNGDYDVEYRTVGVDDQQVRWVRAKGKAYFNEQDEPVRFIGSVLDITQQVNAVRKIEEMVEQRTEELKMANKQLVEANELLTRSNENLQRFAYVASHDLQEPLRKIQQFGDLLSTEYAAALGSQGVYLERMQAAASRMSNLIQDLLSYSRITAQSAVRQPVSLHQVVDQVLTDLELVIEETNARISVGSLPTVTGDATQLVQLFQNLLSNALKFRQPATTPFIQLRAQLVPHADLPVTVKPVRPADWYHQLDVVDNGIGFEPQYAQRIFEAFQRLHRKHEYAGTGIGLSICERVVTSHGGAITASSQPGHGATFTVYLPV
ncbi:PAS domain-containing protein [Fibrivirga algicola]|uniref:histidine kinase n=1 Tax=Fibrivirga algicola TaxID=2950420 RepID=A0ABX0QKU8_9BACT|nr:PAS domain-containing protein [Fibrivirga algicola]NID11775.1 PAS domain-containing protein [Fibrivirga algicola]